MATANAGRKSNQGVSRSDTSTASAAKRRKSARPRPTPVGEWSSLDQALAAQAGWGLFICVDVATLKSFYEISNADDEITHDSAVKLVAALSKKGDELATRALTAVFHSRTNWAGVTKKKRGK